MTEYLLKFSEYMKEQQTKIISKVQSYDSGLKKTLDFWEREDFVKNPGGGGITGVLEGEVIENGGVNTSHIFGEVNPEFAAKLPGNGNEVSAAGLSLILHPRNPRVPTVHANFRMIINGDKYWFGGGADLTPFYPYKEDFDFFHDCWKKALVEYPGRYEKYKKTCDQYFVNRHRNNEMRGVSGIFFDYHNSGNIEEDYSFVTKLSDFFTESYFPILEKRYQEESTPEDEEFQLFRRGRYVEFNLLHDRGTAFGLKTNGRTDSILVSLPKRCLFKYQYKPKPGSVHEEMMKYYQIPNG